MAFWQGWWNSPYSSHTQCTNPAWNSSFFLRLGNKCPCDWYLPLWSCYQPSNCVVDPNNAIVTIGGPSLGSSTQKKRKAADNTSTQYHVIHKIHTLEDESESDSGSEWPVPTQQEKSTEVEELEPEDEECKQQYESLKAMADANYEISMGFASSCDHIIHIISRQSTQSPRRTPPQMFTPSFAGTTRIPMEGRTRLKIGARSVCKWHSPLLWHFMV